VHDIINMHEKFLIVQVSKQPIKYKRGDKSNNRRRSKSLYKIRILNGIRGRQTNRRADSRHEQRQRHNETLHVRRGAGVGNTVGGDIDEDFRASCYSDGNGVQPERERGETPMTMLQVEAALPQGEVL
jgi:hypothetical protein